MKIAVYINEYGRQVVEELDSYNRFEIPVRIIDFDNGIVLEVSEA